MKKVNIIGSIAIFVGAISLALLRFTGLTAHIIISLVALVIMLACMIAGRKSWKVPALEILYRVLYLVALISGFVIYLASAPVALVIAHKISAILFTILFIVATVIAFKSSKE